MAGTMNWGAERLWQQLEPLLPGLSVEVVERMASTNTELLDRARPTPRGDETPSNFGRRIGDTLPCLLVAEHQTQGRGRQGRTWQSAAGASLTFSLSLVLAKDDLSGLSLAVGVALAEALEPQGNAAPSAAKPRVFQVQLKWPNDLWLMDADGTGRKLGGVLIESTGVGGQRMVVIGIGLNVLPQTVRGELASGYACAQELAAQADAPSLLAQVAVPLAQALRQFEREGFAPFVPRFAARDLLQGRVVHTAQGMAMQGVAQGVDDQGHLLLDVGGTVRRLASGEVSVRLDDKSGEA